MNEPVCLVTGVGPGTGTALAKRFAAGGYRVAMLARNAERIEALEQELPGSRAYACDVTDSVRLEEVIAEIERDLGSPSVLIHNAVGGAWGTFRDLDPSVLQRAFDINVVALLNLARRLAPAMEARGDGAIIVTGNTAAHRGRPKYAHFAPTKAAQRILSEVLARDLGPSGVHVAYIVIDAVIDVPWTRERFPDKPDDDFITPEAIAEEAWHIRQQDRSAWSFNVELRPFREVW